MNDILVGRNGSAAVELDPHFGNRHGMIAGAPEQPKVGPKGKVHRRTLSSTALE